MKITIATGEKINVELGGLVGALLKAVLSRRRRSGRLRL